MRKLFVVILFCISALFAFANDGVFFAAGNQLIPITETDISVKKEVLTINRVGDHLEVTVYYQFFNPVGEKELLVGFEAMSPYNDMKDFESSLPFQPHIRNFKVFMNGEPLPFEVANVKSVRYDKEKYPTTPPYYRNGSIQGWTMQQLKDTLAVWDYPSIPIDYVYHFKTKFHPGLNTIQHIYEYDLSFSAGDEYYFPYILTAANRWANHQIDDFQLIINMGDRESFMVHPDFFKSADEWVINGRGKATIDSTWVYGDDVAMLSCPVFHIQEGGISFRKANFHPEGELTIEKRRICTFYDFTVEGNDYTELLQKYALGSQYYPFPQILSIYDNEMTIAFTNDSTTYSHSIDTLVTPEQRRILKYLPYAYRGYIFKTKELQEYFESTDWYVPNPDYKGNMGVMTEEEKKWVGFWDELSLPEDAIIDYFCEPYYEDGPDSLQRFIQQNLRIPPGYENTTGVVLVEFIVETDGSVSNPRVKLSLNPVLDAEAVRVVMSIQNKWVWDPSRCYNGEIHRSHWQIPVQF